MSFIYCKHGNFNVDVNSNSFSNFAFIKKFSPMLKLHHDTIMNAYQSKLRKLQPACVTFWWQNRDIFPSQK